MILKYMHLGCIFQMHVLKNKYFSQNWNFMIFNLNKKMTNLKQDEAKLKKEAEQDVVKPKICKLEASEDADVKKYYKSYDSIKELIITFITL